VLCFACYAEGPATSSGTQTTWMRLLRHFGSSRNLIYTKNSANSFVSPTSKKIARKCFLSPTYAKTGGGTSNQMIFANAPLRLSNPGGYNRLENLALNFVLSTVNCKSAFLTPAFTTTSINIVGAPTFWFLRAAKGSPKNRSEDRPLHRKECGPPRNPIRGANNVPQKAWPYTNCGLSVVNFAPPLSFLRIFLHLKLATDHLKLHNPNHSRTYAREACKSNHSRRCA